MPDERVPDDEHPVLLAKLDKTIGSSKVVFIRLRMDQRPLENIFRSDAVEVSADNPSPARVFFKDLSPVERRTNLEVTLKNIFQRSLLRRNGKTHQATKHNKTKNNSFLCLFVAILWPLRA